MKNIIIAAVIIWIQVIFHSVHSATIYERDILKQSGWFTDNNQYNPSAVHDGKSTRDLQSIFEEFKHKRNTVINNEQNSSFGSGMKLNAKEQMANEIIRIAKNDELQSGFLNPYMFNPARHIFEVLNHIKQSNLFQIIQMMPKGGVLHIHEMAMCSTDYLVSLTYWPNLWQRTSNKTENNRIEEFRFARTQPPSTSSSSSSSSASHSNKKIKQKNPESTESDSNVDSIWRLVRDVRAEMGASVYDEHVRTMFTLYDKNTNPWAQYRDINEIWDRFLVIFDNVKKILTYLPVRRAYIYRVLRELYEDGVQYVEIRSSLPTSYDLYGNNYTSEDTIKLFDDVLNQFKHEYPLFIGAKLIYSPTKLLANEPTETYFDTIRKLHIKYPDILVGFDLVGQEDRTPPLSTYAEHILSLPESIKFFFHAGETDWFGSVDENLVDAVLLGSRRIGHGYALTKHPNLIDLVKTKNIAVEVNPISNQVLKLVDDYRNHPASILLAQNVPVVISSDDPSFWEVSPLSHDFYITYLGIASRHSDLRTLKQFALNSILYSSLEGYEKIEAILKWQIKWDKFIEQILLQKSV